MSKKFNSAEELNQYLDKIEKRIETLESENKQLIKRNQPTRLPETNIVSTNFLKRAFAIWGHFFTAHIILSIIFLAIYLCIITIGLGTIASRIKTTEGSFTPATTSTSIFDNLEVTPLYVLPQSYSTQTQEP